MKDSMAAAARRKDLLVLSTIERLPNWYEEKVVARYIADGDCLVWPVLRPNGYGQVNLPMVNGRRATVSVHRVAYIVATGEPIPYGLTLDHLCRRRGCANEMHLDAVDIRTNLLRGQTRTAYNASRTACPKGHPLEGDNLDPWSLRRGQRKCLRCVRQRSRDGFLVIDSARRALGLTWAHYVATYGQGTAAAKAILDENMERAS